MSKQTLSFDVTRILYWDVGAVIKRILMFDVNRILFADLGQLLLHPVLQVIYKTVLGFSAITMVTMLTAEFVFGPVSADTEKVLARVCMVLALAWVAPDVRRLWRQRAAQ